MVEHVTLTDPELHEPKGVSTASSGEVYVAGTHYYPQFKEIIERVANTESEIKVLFGHDNPNDRQDNWTNSSDHGPFHSAGIPFIYFGVEDHQYYHKESDEFNKIEPQFYINVVNMIIKQLEAFDQKL